MMHKHPVRPKLLAVIDTGAVCLVVLYLLSNTDDPGLYWILPISLVYAGLLLQVYWKQSPLIGLGELANFFVSISLWDALTGRVPHDRVHPKIGSEHHCPVCDNPPDIYKINSFLDGVGYFLIAVPILLSVVMTKLSAILTGPLLYIGFSFTSTDYEAMSLDARRKYKSSFKQLWILFGSIGIALFFAKVVIHSVWNSLHAWWVANPVLSHFDPVIRPAAFLPFHLTGLLGAVLLIFIVSLVDKAIHVLDDQEKEPVTIQGLLRTIRALVRTRQILSIYTSFCFAWLLLPWLKYVRFPPVTLELLPK